MQFGSHVAKIPMVNFFVNVNVLFEYVETNPIEIIGTFFRMYITSVSYMVYMGPKTKAIDIYF